MKTYYTKTMDTGKCNPLSLGFLKRLGWKIESGWCVRGDEPVEVTSPDRYSVYIVDKRYQPEKMHAEYITSWKASETQ